MNRRTGKQSLPPIQSLTFGGGKRAFPLCVVQPSAQFVKPRAQGIQLTAAEAPRRKVVYAQRLQKISQMFPITQIKLSMA